jgi:ribonuclease BN (tRNA processing enzyme)
MPFEVIVLGVGDTFTTRHHTTALLLCCDGFALAVDCPDRYRSVLRVAAERTGRPLALESIDHVLITHVHGDHMNGLEGVAWYKHFAEGKRVRLLCSPEVRETIWDTRLSGSMSRLWNGSDYRSLGFDDYFEHVPLAWEGETVAGPFHIRAYRTKHHVPTSAILVEAGGARFGYSADTAFDPDLITFLAEADLVVHETNLGPAHTPYDALAALPEDLRRRMRLIHFPDEMEGMPTAIPMLNEGDVLTLPTR